MAMSDMPQPGDQQNELLAAALTYAARGWYVFPVHAPARSGGCTCGEPDCTNIGKHPLTPHGLKDASTDPKVIRAWWKRWPWANVAIATGARSGLLVPDIDILKGGMESFKAIQDRYGPLTNSLTSNTGSGGAHLLYQHPGPNYLLRNKTRLDGYPGLDVRGDGGYIVAPPSLHASGARYEWNLADEPVRPMPAWLLTLLQRERTSGEEERRDRQPGDATPEEAREAVTFWTAKATTRAVVGDRNETAFWWACQLRDAGVSETDAEGAADLFYDGLADATGFSIREVTNAIRNAYRANPRERARSQGLPFRQLTQPQAPWEERHPQGGEPPEPPDDDSDPESPGEDPHDDDGRGDHTDLGNARRFVTRYGEDVRYVYFSRLGRWHVWDGTRFEEDDTGGAERLAQDTARAILKEANGIQNPRAFNETRKWAKASRSDARIKAMLNLARTQAEVAVRASQLDTDHMLLNTTSGVVDLRTGELLPHNRAYLMTKRAGTGYAPDGACPMWLQFLNTIFAGDAELIAYIQRAIGYSLTGDTHEQCLFICHGHGSNGKSTLFNVVSKLLGEYARTARTETLITKQNPGISNDIARLDGARFVTASEANEGDTLDEAFVKSVTGSDPMTARFMFQEFFEFSPILKLWLATNNEPVIRGTDNGIKRRIRLIPFKVTIPDGEKIENFDKRLIAQEGDAILAWAVRGCLEWQRIGLAPPEAVRTATADYLERQDRLGQFLAEICVLNPAYQVSNKALRVAYTGWCEEYGDRPLGPQRFGQQLRHRGFTSSRSGGDGSTVWYGMGIKATGVPGDTGDG